MATSETTLKEGYLVKAPDVAKYLHNVKKWQRKWFQLDTNGDLYYYDNEKSSKPNGVIHMLQCYRMFDGKTKGIQMSYCCGLEVGESTYYLKAESASSFSEWVKLLGEFFEVCEVMVDPLDERRGTMPSEDGGERTWRSGSIQSRHLSVTTKAKFLSKEGWLAKTGSNNKGWRDRYFKLHNGKLLYFKNEKVDTPQGDIDLFLCTSVEKTAGKKGYGLDLHIPGRVFNMSAENEEEQDSWISVITNTLSQIRDITDSTSLHRSGSNSSNVSSSSVSKEVTAPQEEKSIVGSDLSPLPQPHRADLTSSVRSEEELTHSGIERSRSESFNTEPSTHSDREDHKDSVVQLLEAEVDVLRTKVASIQSDLKTTTAVNNQLQQQLSEVKRSQAVREKELSEEKRQLAAQVGQLEKAKQELENINDSVTAQLQHNLERVQELDEDLLVIRHEFDESQLASTAVEEELSETQQRLQEIEQVALELETALKKRESEPATPLTSSFRSFGLPYQPHTDAEETTPMAGSVVEAAANKLKSSATAELNESNLVEDLRKELSTLTEDNKTLKEQLKTQQDGLSEQEQAQIPNTDTAVTSTQLEEEKLKWQMDTENLRRELTASFDTEREKITTEKTSLNNELTVLKETVTKLESGSQEKVLKLEQKLSDSEERITQLEKDVDTYQGKIAQLQVEKEKALSDLITIRKTNKSIEKRMSESEDSRVSSPMLLSAASSRPNTPEMSSKLTELEKKIEQLTTALSEVEAERDLLKSKVDRLTSGLQNTPDFHFKSKSGASVASSTVSTAANHGPPVANGSTQSLESAEISSTQGTPPPKPRRPPTEVVSKWKQNTNETSPSIEEELQPRLRSRTATLLKSLFPPRR